MAFDEKAGDGWCRHLHYDALMADPVETVRALYAQLRRGGRRRSTPGACTPSSSTGRRTPSAGTATTRPTSAGRYPGLATEFGDYTERYHMRPEIQVDQATGHTHACN